MNLLSVLSKLLNSSSVRGALANNTGVSADSIGNLLQTALPKLLGSLTSNASSADGARSLLSAIGQHATDSSIEDQIANADAEDGGKIIGHILGDDAASTISGFAEQTGLSTDQVSGVLNNVAPSLMSNLSSVMTNGLPEIADDDDGEDKTGGIGGFLGKLFGGKDDEDTSAFDGTSLLSALSALGKN